MNIGDVTNSSYSSAKHLKPQSIKSTKDQDARNSGISEKTDENPDVVDSIDISDEARKALAAEQKRIQEFEDAQELLNSLPEMSPARRQELLERLNSGYYTKPEVISQIAGRISKDIK